MEYCRGLDSRRVNNNYDVTRIDMVRDLLKDGVNPLGFTVNSSRESVTITARDIFAYRMENKIPFSIIISGRRK